MTGAVAMLLALAAGAVGIYIARIDRDVSTAFEAHRVLGIANVPLLEDWLRWSGCRRGASR